MPFLLPRVIKIVINPTLKALGTAELTELRTQIINEIQNRINADNNLQNQITLVSGSLVTEIQDRINTDNNLQNQITLVSGSLTTEIQNRTNVDNNLQNQITLVSGSLTTEIQNRISEDNNLQNQITLVSGSLVTEIQDRINTDNNLQNQITLVSGSLTTEIQDRINADNNLQNQINQLAASGSISTGENLGNGEGIYIDNSGSILQFKTLKGSGSINVSTIGNEIIIDGQDLQSQITLVSGSLTTEIQNRTNVDNNLQNQITLVSGSLVTEIQDRVNADNNLQNQITLVSGSLVTEIQDRVNADNNLQNQITLVSGSLVTEIQNRINADNNLQNQITLVSGSLVTEIQNRINADNNLQNQIDQLVISGSISTGENLGNGEGIYIGNSGSILQFKTLKGSGSINVSTIGNEIIIVGTGGSGSISQLERDVVEEFVLTSTDITNKKVVLAYTPINSNYVRLDVIGGCAQSNGNDFIVNTMTKELSWSGLGLDGILSVGDRLRVTYNIMSS